MQPARVKLISTYVINSEHLQGAERDYGNDHTKSYAELLVTLLKLLSDVFFLNLCIRETKSPARFIYTMDYSSRQYISMNIFSAP